MKVYIAERGVYEDRWIEGVYATPDLAMAANPGTDWRYYPDDESWSNQLDMDDACRIFTEVVLESADEPLTAETSTYSLVEVPVVNGFATLPDGRQVASESAVVVVPLIR